MTASHQHMNDAIRRAARGDAITVDRVERPIGQIGIGRGGACIPRRPTSPSMSGMIRAARSLQREHLLDRAEFYDQIQDALR